MLDDETRWSQWMVEAQKGDKSSYNLLLSELTQVMTAYLRKRFGSAPFVDDCVQESLLAIHTARQTYAAGRAFKPWMNAIIKYKTIDILRKNHRHNAASFGDETLNNTNNKELSSLQIDIERHIAGAQILAKLPKEHSEALLLTKMVGFSIDETAKQLNITQSAVKQRVRRAIAKTHKILASDAL